MSNRNLLLGLGAALALFATGCDADKLTEVNTNPNSPTDAPSSALFTTASRLSASRWLDGVGGTRYGFLAQHLAEVQYPESDQYKRLAASSTSGIFNGAYSSELQDLRVIIDRNKSAGEVGPAQVLSQYGFGRLTDVFGPVPYSEAFDPDIVFPTYDSQQDIYTGIFAKLTEASGLLATATNTLGSGDPIYAGNPAAWRRFANSLRLRHAMQLTNVAAECCGATSRVGVQVAAARADAGGLILNNSENAALAWPGDGIYDSPWANNFKTRDDHRISTRLLTMMSQYDDPRLAIYAMPAPVVVAEIAGRTKNYCPGGGTTCYVGLENALTHAQAQALMPNTSRPGAIFYPGPTTYGTFGGSGKAFPSYFFTAAETYFLLAEAAQRGIGGLTAVDAPNYYNLGITRSMEMWGIGAAAIATYLATPGVAYVPGNAGLVQIAEQKWVALYIDPIQAWSDVRRTCRPAYVQPGPAAYQSIIPRRLQYSTNDRSVNRAAYDVGVAALSPASDLLSSRFYWDNLAGWQASPTYVAGCSDRST